MERIYLDYAATTPMHPEVIEVMSDALKETYGNASSIYQRGRESRNQLNEAKEVFAKSISSKPSEIIMTSGGTESNNYAIVKSAEKNKEYGNHVITTSIEHDAVLNPMNYLESKGFEVTYLRVDKNGLVSVEQVEEALREDTILVSIMSGNNEVGSLMPIKEIGELVKGNSRALFHTDAVQAYGSQNIDVVEMNIDLLSVSSHKINGPKGIGFLYQKENVYLPSLLLGGEQENKRRAGTENIPAIIGFKKAVEIMLEEQEDRNAQEMAFKNRVIEKLNEEQIDFSINGLLEPSLPHVLSLHIKDVFSEKLLIQLDLKGVEAAAGSACTAGNIEPSHVLEAMFGEEAPEVSETIRLSFGMGLDLDQIDQAMDVMIGSIHNLKK